MDDRAQPISTASVVSGELMLLACAVIALLVFDIGVRVAINPWAIVAGAFAGLAPAALIPWTLSSKAAWIAGLRRRVLREFGPWIASSSWWHLVVVSGLAGLCEELFFRGALMSLFDRWWGPLPALLLSSLVFGLMHPLGRTYIMVAAALGCYFGLLVLVSHNLGIPILSHFLYDLVALFAVRHALKLECES